MVKRDTVFKQMYLVDHLWNNKHNNQLTITPNPEKILLNTQYSCGECEQNRNVNQLKPFPDTLENSNRSHDDDSSSSSSSDSDDELPPPDNHEPPGTNSGYENNHPPPNNYLPPIQNEDAINHPTNENELGNQESRNHTPGMEIESDENIGTLTPGMEIDYNQDLRDESEQTQPRSDRLHQSENSLPRFSAPEATFPPNTFSIEKENDKILERKKKRFLKFRKAQRDELKRIRRQRKGEMKARKFQNINRAIDSEKIAMHDDDNFQRNLVKIEDSVDHQPRLQNQTKTLKAENDESLQSKSSRNLRTLERNADKISKTKKRKTTGRITKTRTKLKKKLTQNPTANELVENITDPKQSTVTIKNFAHESFFPNKRNIARKEGKFFCRICNTYFQRYSLLKKHLDSSHQFEEYDVTFPDSQKYLAVATKKMENEELNNKTFYGNYNTKPMDLTSYWCSHCHKFFISFESHMKHMRKFHSEDKASTKRSITRDRLKRTLYEPVFKN